ncbi:helix-turn-helix domain-containing protein [Thermoproteota archaeon]
MVKPVNHRYFDRESKVRDYMLGVSYTCSTIQGNRVAFRSQHEDLVELVKRELRSEHSITPDPRQKSSYVLEFSSPYMIEKLHELGAGVPKQQRRYPEVANDNHFIRGITDGQANISGGVDSYLHITICYNKEFLNGMYKVLKQAGVQRDHPKVRKNVLFLSQDDAMILHDFIYQNWDYVRDRKIYLPSKKQAMENHYKKKEPDHTNPQVAQRIERAKELLKQGYTGTEVSNLLGYSFSTGFFRAFQKATGMTPGEFIEQEVTSQTQARS